MTRAVNNCEDSWLIPVWPAPAHVRALTTLRKGGSSQEPFASFNMAMHVGDDEQHVMANRQSLRQQLSLSKEPAWLQQTHSQIVVRAEKISNNITEADASFTSQPGLPCVVMTADCLPLLITDRKGSCVAAVHAGWRGLADGIIEKTLNAMPVDKTELLVWLGPAIGPHAYEVGDDVRQVFLEQNAQAEQAFRQVDENHWMMDIYQLARQRLHHHHVTDIYGGEYCTFTDVERFYSYRRDNITGRMASLIWLEEDV